ncbi:MAG: HAD-IIIA family hydrolase [Deltaproteobacteria bacterium]|nr:HAD-IIIA family hydrolase [Deltaproteobacteria bacterium]MBW1924653.1 HAD-IIIA family hydrolase [Deltaproteobacteria bacterium]MBW1950515.1 HAD-IIIA family hydrolase [Deltaproteobacteria bacterium]MBW2008514.1 HAD-IIIA family hydrolase [Deltaproteobacteria bacterium]MBW2348334.1 HAD-IIIA family hydrolase [Deltaproteobacteria bacterium]
MTERSLETGRSNGGETGVLPRILFLDVDGVLTDGRVYYTDEGSEIKAFHVRDGLGLKLLMRAGVAVVIVTGRDSQAVVRRARELGIEGVYQGVSDKGALCRRLLREKGLRGDEAACIGDDLPDLEIFREVGLRIAVADAAEEVRQAAHLVTERKGGHGAVREACEWLLRSTGKWPGELGKIGFTDLKSR